MSSFAPIVVGTDGSTSAKTALREAARLASLLGARVHVVYVTYRTQATGDGATDGRSTILSDAAAAFEADGVEVETHARIGDPADAILAVAEEQRAGLIVVGNRGMTGARRYLLGDVPNKLSHHAPCNVMIVKTTDESGRGTIVLAGLASAGVGAVLIGEMVRLWRRGSSDAARQSVDVALAGYRAGSTRERALLKMLAAFVVTSAVTRRSTWVIRRQGKFGPIREMARGPRHIHHFVPGIVLAFASGGVAVVTNDRRIREWLSVPLGAGVALTLDEWALLLELNDVYWSEEGVVSVQVTLGTTALLAGLTVGVRLLRQGERQVG